MVTEGGWECEVYRGNRGNRVYRVYKGNRENRENRGKGHRA